MDAVAATKVSPNIYLETAAGEVTHRGFERLVEGAGADKVLYGSDMPLFDARIDIARSSRRTSPTTPSAASSASTP